MDNSDSSETTQLQYKPFIIGVAGGTASGKTTVCEKICDFLDCERVKIISMDSFYKPLTPEQHANVANYNFDHPDAFDWEYLVRTMRDISQGFVVQIPTYDFVTHSRTSEVVVFYPGDIVMFEGILSLYRPELSDLFDLKVFVSTDADIRVCRRLKRDIVERGRSVASVLEQYQKTVKPSFDQFCAPTRSLADIIVPHGGENKVAINLLVTHIRSQLHFRMRVDIASSNCIIPDPINLESTRPILSLELIRELMQQNSDIETHRYLLKPFSEMISQLLQQAVVHKGEQVSIISLVQSPWLQSFTKDMGIDNFYYLPDAKGLLENRGSFVGAELMKKPRPLQDSDFLETRDVLEQLADTHIFIFDGLTFSGNRVRALLIWLLEEIGVGPCSVVNMIASQKGQNILAHSFCYAQFYTLSQMTELNDIWDLPAEGQFVRSLMKKMSIDSDHETEPESNI